MTIEQYAKEVNLMDELQQKYFKTRDKDILNESKVQERKVRALTKQILSTKLTEPILFSDYV